MRHTVLIALATLFGVAACQQKRKTPAKRPPAPPRAPAPPKASNPAKPLTPPAGAACAEATPARGKAGIAWFHDDYAAALACARQRRKPLVVDAWAPWCHTCLSMKQTVLRDVGLASLAPRFVWLAVDTDKKANADFMARVKMTAWPTFFVLSPRTARVEARHVGAASVSQFREFLRFGERAHLASLSDQRALSPLLAALSEADRAAAAGKWNEAAAGYDKVLRLAPPGWPRRPEVLVAQIGTLYRLGRWDRCIALATENLARTGASASAGDFIAYADYCARRGGDPAAIKRMRKRAAARLATVAADPRSPLSIDDRSDALRILRELYDALGDRKAARAAALRQRQLLDDTCRRAKRPEVVATYHWPRAEVYVYLGVGKELIAPLERSIAALPKAYDPPSRLAWVHLKTGSPAKALAMAKRALALAYGPRKARVFSLIAKIHAVRGDPDAQRRTLEAGIAHLQRLPAGQRSARALDTLRQALTALGPPPKR